jgi:hypothetical protein
MQRNVIDTHQRAGKIIALTFGAVLLKTPQLKSDVEGSFRIFVGVIIHLL